MVPVRRALDRFLRAHEPYPALVVDRQHNLITANDALGALTGSCDPELFEPPANSIRIALHPNGMAPRIVNFGEWSAHLVGRLRCEVAITGDDALEALLAEVANYSGVSTLWLADVAGREIGIALMLKDHEGELAFISAISTFGTAVDITLAELSIEAFYPANAATATRMLGEHEC